MDSRHFGTDPDPALFVSGFKMPLTKSQRHRESNFADYFLKVYVFTSDF